MSQLDTDKLRDVIFDLYLALGRGTNSVKCVVANMGKWKLRVDPYHTDAGTKDNRSITVPIVGFSAVAEPNTNEQVEIGRTVKRICDQHGFKISKAYRFKNCEYLTYFVSPIWDKFMK